MLEEKSMPPNMAANATHNTLLKKSKCHKVSPLNTFPFEFGV